MILKCNSLLFSVIFPYVEGHLFMPSSGSAGSNGRLLSVVMIDLPQLFHRTGTVA